MEFQLEIFKEESNQILSSTSENFKKQVHQPSVQLMKLPSLTPIVWLRYQNIQSTMIPAEKWSEHHLKQFFFVFQAESQTAGKGQGSNLWSSPPGNIYLTVLTKIKPTFAPFLSMLACSAVLQTIRQQISGLSVGCKWVNDIFIDFSKVGGILSKCSISGENFFGIIGIGINIASSPLFQSTNLQKYKKEKIDLRVFTERLITNFFWCLQNKEESLILYQKSLLYVGEEVNIWDVQLKNILHSGIFEGVNELGHAVLTEEGKKIQVHSGRMRVKNKIVQVSESILSQMEQRNPKRASYLI